MAATTVLLLASVCLAYTVTETLAQTAPLFTQEVYRISVNESNQAAGFPRPQNGFLTVTCIDPTTNTTPVAITYTILDSPLPFGIDDSSGALSVTQDLDYDTPPQSYEFNVSCYNGSFPELNTTALVSITLDPVNDNIPVLDTNSFQVFITEITPPGTALVSTQPGAIRLYSVTDADVGEGSDIVFTLSESSEDLRFFSLDMITGTLVLNQTIDIDTTNRTIIGGFIRFSTRITVCDTNPPSEQCPNLLVEVLEASVNDHLPQFSNDSYLASFLETTPTSTVLVVATCTDGDRAGTAGSFSGITLSNHTQNVADHFMVDSVSGNISLIQELDYEMGQLFNFTVLCSDTGGETTSAQVIIDVLPENDNFPMFINGTMRIFSYNFSVTRTAPIGFVVGQVTATDADIGTTTEITFGIETNEYFNIEKSTGVITVSNSLVNSTDDILTVNVTVSDGTFYSSAVVFIDINYHLPQFSKDSYFASFPETTPNGTVLVVATCTDGDRAGTAGSFSGITLSNPTQNVIDHFMVDSVSGNISLIQELDYEMDQLFNFTVLCSDTGGETTSAQVIIDVLPENDNFPMFINGTMRIFSYNFSVTRTAPIGFVVGQVTATDADIGTTTEITYEIEPNEYFNIEKNTGVIMVSNSLVNSTDNILTVNVTVSDGTFYSSAVVFIDVQSDLPKFAADRYNATFTEDFEVGSVIVQLRCSDNHREIDGYELLNPSTAVEETFALSNTGDLTLRKSFDICEQTRYEFMVVCVDNKNQMDNTTVEISVQGGTIYFENCSYTFDFDRLTMPNNGEEIGRVRAIGRGVIEYSLDNDQFFRIDGSGRIFSSNYILVSQGNTINLHVQARVGQASDTVNVTINVRGPLSFLEIYIIAAACAALLIILLICILIACCCCCFREDKSKTMDEAVEQPSQSTTARKRRPFRSSVTIPKPKQPVTESGLSDDDEIGKSTEDLMKPKQFSKIPEEGEESSQETQEVSYTGEVTAEEGEKTSLMEDDHEGGTHREHAKLAESSKMKETEEEEVETSKIQAVAHVGAAMSGDEEKGETMQLRESKPGQKENACRVKQNEEEETESSKIQAVAHVGAVMSGEEENSEMMQLRESASLVKRRRVPSK